jgi:hypothetical protein
MGDNGIMNFRSTFAYGYGVGDILTSIRKEGRMIPGFVFNVFEYVWRSIAKIMSCFP